MKQCLSIQKNKNTCTQQLPFSVIIKTACSFLIEVKKQCTVCESVQQSVHPTLKYSVYKIIWWFHLETTWQYLILLGSIHHILPVRYCCREKGIKLFLSKGSTHGQVAFPSVVHGGHESRWVTSDSKLPTAGEWKTASKPSRRAHRGARAGQALGCGAARQPPHGYPRPAQPPWRHGAPAAPPRPAARPTLTCRGWALRGLGPPAGLWSGGKAAPRSLRREDRGRQGKTRGAAPPGSACLCSA